MASRPSIEAGPVVALSEQTVKGKTRVDRLSDVKSLNCWGQDLADVSVLCEMSNVEVLSLSVNRISTLKDFSQCIKLQELYLRKNEVAEVTEVQWLAKLPDLRVLWLSDNPCAETPNYRSKVLQLLPKLVKLDNDDVTAQERKESLEAAQKASEPQPSASNVSMPSEQLPVVASQLPLGANPVLEQVHQPAQLQAALAPPLQADSSNASLAEYPIMPQPAAPLAVTTKSSAEPSAPLPHSQPSFKAQENIGARCTPTSNGSSSSNVLYAVIALLGDLDERSLRLVRAEIEQRLKQR